jgi:hypothetical protein
MVRRLHETSDALRLKDWFEIPRAKPKGMRLARYLRLIQRRQRLLNKLAEHWQRRRRIIGNNKKLYYETMVATGLTKDAR